MSRCLKTAKQRCLVVFAFSFWCRHEWWQVYTSKRCWHCRIPHLLEKYQNFATLERTSACSPQWEFGGAVVWLNEETEEVLWRDGPSLPRRSNCQRGHIRPAEVELWPARPSSTKHLGRRKSCIWAGESEPHNVIDIIYKDLLVTSMAFSRLGEDRGVCCSAWNIYSHCWLADYAGELHFLWFLSESEQGHCRRHCGYNPQLQYDAQAMGSQRRLNVHAMRLSTSGNNELQTDAHWHAHIVLTFIAGEENGSKRSFGLSAAALLGVMDKLDSSEPFGMK